MTPPPPHSGDGAPADVKAIQIVRNPPREIPGMKGRMKPRAAVRVVRRVQATPFVGSDAEWEEAKRLLDL